jgi:hypothetical protein
MSLCARKASLTCRLKALRTTARLAKRLLAETAKRDRPLTRKQQPASTTPDETLVPVRRIRLTESFAVLEGFIGSERSLKRLVH